MLTNRANMASVSTADIRDSISPSDFQSPYEKIRFQRSPFRRKDFFVKIFVSFCRENRLQHFVHSLKGNGFWKMKPIGLYRSPLQAVKQRPIAVLVGRMVYEPSENHIAEFRVTLSIESKNVSTVVWKFGIRDFSRINERERHQSKERVQSEDDVFPRISNILHAAFDNGLNHSEFVGGKPHFFDEPLKFIRFGFVEKYFHVPKKRSNRLVPEADHFGALGQKLVFFSLHNFTNLIERRVRFDFAGRNDGFSIRTLMNYAHS